MKVGVFDSGLGGLTVLSELLKVSKGVEFYYFGDTARVPYGIRSTETVVRYATECVNFLTDFGMDALVIACNTASAKAYSELKRNFKNLEIYEVITPAVERVVKVAKKSVGVIGTPATIGSNIYKKRIEVLNSKLKVFQKATPLLVPLVEEGLTEGTIAEEVLKHYLSEWEGKIDTLLLGCTHYPLLQKGIEKLFPHWEIVNSAQPLAEKLSGKLQGKGENSVHLYFSDRTAFLEKMVSEIPINGIRTLEIVEWCGRRESNPDGLTASEF